VGFGTELLFIVALGLVVLGPKRLHIVWHTRRGLKLNLTRQAGGTKFQLAAHSKMRLRTPNTLTNPCCPERQMAQSPMSWIHSRRERAGLA
jgi:hypothetical protein